MKFNLPRDSFLSSLQHAGRAIATRGTLPSLSGILVTADTAGVTLRATDMEMGLSLPLAGATVEREGTALLPGRLLGDVARSLPAGDVTVEHRGEQRDVELMAGDAQIHLRVLPAEDFPQLPVPDGDPVKLPAAQLAETIELVARAASRDEIRPILTGVLVQAEEAALTMVATDSYRLSVKHASLEQPISQPLDANVPARALRELARIIAAEGTDVVEITLPRSQIVFKAGGVVLSSRLIDGQFPSWRQLIPETFDHEVRLPREELLEITRRVGQLAQRNAPLRFAFADGQLTIAAETPDIGDATEAMPAPYNGEPLEIAFNPQYLIEGIDSVATEELSLQISSPLRPGLLRPVGSEDFSYLVMPIRQNA